MSSRSRPARSNSSSSLAWRIWVSSRFTYAVPSLAMNEQKSSTISRCASASTRPTQGAAHLPM